MRFSSQRLKAGTEAVIVGGHRSELNGSRPHYAINGLHLQECATGDGTKVQKRRIFTVDIQHLQPCRDTVASMDDGPSLRWRLYPPPLTVFTAKHAGPASSS